MNDSPVSDSGHGRRGAWYVVGLAAAVAAFLAIAWVGEHALATARPSAIQPASGSGADVVLHVLLALTVIVATTRLTGSLFRQFHQPPVIGEIVGGILLGPSLLGTIAPAASAFLLPPAVAPFLNVIAQLGVVLYMFTVGLHLDLGIVRRRGPATLAVSHASIVVPFLLGSLLAVPLYERLAGPSASFTAFALFLGVSMSVTAFPVLARILGDKGLHTTPLGMLALTCAAVDDVTAWCLLALVVSVMQATPWGAALTAVLTVAYIGAMLVVVRPAVLRAVPWLERADRVHEGGLAVVLVALLLSALATELIGIHAIFGAFLLGAMVPSDSRTAAEITDRIGGLVRVLFLPAFFAFTGMRTEIGLMGTWQDWAVCALVILVATAGKFGGTFVAARWSGLTGRDAASLGILMNTRGLVELIVLNVGLDIGAVSPRLFTMLVIMALVTTFMTTPLLDLVMRGRSWAMVPAGTRA